MDMKEISEVLIFWKDGGYFGSLTKDQWIDRCYTELKNCTDEFKNTSDDWSTGSDRSIAFDKASKVMRDLYLLGEDVDIKLLKD